MAFKWRHFRARRLEKVETDRVRTKEMPFEEIGLTVGYILIAGLWVVLSGDAVDWLLGAPLDSPGLQALKGMNFVLTTALLM